MGQNRKAPKILGWTDRRGVPIPAIIFTNACGALSMMNISTGAGKAYSYIVNLSGVSTFLVWGAISFIHIRFRTAWKKQGHSPDELPFKSFLYPYNAYFGLAANIFLALIQGWEKFAPFDAGGFVDAYILLPLFPIIWFGYKLIFKTHFWRSDEMDLMSGRRKDVDYAKEVANGQFQDKKPSLWTRLKRNF
jgi:amino acid transporter